MALRSVDEWDERLAVVVDGEVLKVEVAVDFIVAVGFGGVIVGADGHAAVVEARAGVRVEELVED